MTLPVDSGPHLLLNWHESDSSSRVLRAGAGSIAAHVVIVAVLAMLATLDTGRPEKAPELARVHRNITPLIAPTPLTQKAPNRKKAATEVKLENLVPERQVAQRMPAATVTPRKVFQAPPQSQAAPSPKPSAAPPQEAPRIEASLKPPQALAGSPAVQPPPPEILPVEKPKLALETPGQSGSAPQRGGTLKIPIPKASVEEAMHSVARGGGQGGLSVGDSDQPASLGDVLRQAPSHGKTASSLDLLSDPMGVDFKPYLIRVLAMVRRNWFAVIPESVRLGRRGKVTLQFAIDRSGGVPKLVIAMPSGAEALDRAAVAGVSASVPFPPLPKEFPGQQIRLQFSFQYNQ